MNPTIKIKLHNDHKQHKFYINLKESRVYRPREEVKPSEHPHIRLLLLLAHQMQALINEGKAKDLHQIAQWTNMQYSRVCQVMNFLLLAPTIQEEIICSKDEQLYKIAEYKIRDLLQELRWDKQQEKWQAILQEYSPQNLSSTN